MAQRTITIVIDDLTGEELPPGSGETVEFSLDGVRYEIDVDAPEAEQLRGTLAPYVHAGRRLSPTGRTIYRAQTSASPTAVRAWAASNGIKVSDRGRIPAAIVEQYRAAGN